MQFGTRVRRAGETTSAKDAGPHPEIAPVFLHQHIRRDLRCSKEAVLRLVDRHRFVDAFAVGMRGDNFPSLIEFRQWQPVGRVAINFVRARENEHGFRAVEPGGFEQVQRADGIHTEIRVRLARGPFVGRLRGRVDDDFDPGTECDAHARKFIGFCLFAKLTACAGSMETWAVAADVMSPAPQSQSGNHRENPAIPPPSRPDASASVCRGGNVRGARVVRGGREIARRFPPRRRARRRANPRARLRRGS